MDLSNPGSTEMAIAVSLPLGLAAYVGFVLIPAWTSYGRLWERFAASFLTLFVLASLLGLGIAVGVAVIYVYTGNV